MKTKQERNLSTGLAVRTTLKAGTIYYDPGEDQNPCVSICDYQNKLRINEGWPVSASLDEYNKCLKTC